MHKNLHHSSSASGLGRKRNG